MTALLQEKGPREFRDAASDAYARAYTEAHPSEVDSVAAKLVRNAGWYKTSDGSWKQLTPDLREKVNIRKGVRQPDGDVLVEDVDVFYPNQVKGDDEASNYTAEKIAEYVANTNASVEAGSQPPGLVCEHPHPSRKANGIPTPVNGHGFNWRNSPRGKGWVRCDLLVRPKLFEEWKRGDWIGLSAGFACDKNQSNMRFGHIALLGADMQALSRLPKVEVFSTGCDEQLCFSADPTVFQRRCDIMPKLTEQQKTAFKKMSAAQAAAALAFAAYAEDKPEAADLDAKAKTEFAAAETAFQEAGLQAQTFGSTDEGNELYDENKNTPTPEDEELDKLLAEEPAATTEAHAGGDDGEGGGGQYAAETAQQFAAIKAQLAQAQSEINNSKKVIAALVGQKMRTEFSAFLEQKAKDGHQFDSQSTLNLFDAIAANPEAVKQLKSTIERSPIDPKLLNTFSTENPAAPVNVKQGGDNGASAGATAAEIKEVQSLAARYCPGLNFSAADIALGFTATSVK